MKFEDYHPARETVDLPEPMTTEQILLAVQVACMRVRTNYCELRRYDNGFIYRVGQTAEAPDRRVAITSEQGEPLREKQRHSRLQLTADPEFGPHSHYQRSVVTPDVDTMIHSVRTLANALRDEMGQ